MKGRNCLFLLRKRNPVSTSEAGAPAAFSMRRRQYHAPDMRGQSSQATAGPGQAGPAAGDEGELQTALLILICNRTDPKEHTERFARPQGHDR